MSLRWNIAQSVERKWWQRYLHDKSVDQYLDWKRKYWQELISPLREMIQFEKPQEILDAGCGPAGVFMVLEGHKVTAVDPLLERYAADLPHFDQIAYPWVEFRNQQLELLSDQHRFDVVFCLNAINHVEDYKKSWDALMQSARPGGWVIISIDAHNYPVFKHLFRAVPGDILHPHQHDLEEYRSMMTSRGCKVEYEKKVKSEFFFDHWILAGRMDQK